MSDCAHGFPVQKDFFAGDAVQQGSFWTRAFVFGVKDKTTGALSYEDFASCALRMQLRAARDPNLPAVLDLSVTGGLSFFCGTIPGYPTQPAPGHPNGIQITVTDQDSLGVVPCRYAYELFCDHFPPADEPQLIFWGTIAIEATGTR